MGKSFDLIHLALVTTSVLVSLVGLAPGLNLIIPGITFATITTVALIYEVPEVPISTRIVTFIAILCAWWVAIAIQHAIAPGLGDATNRITYALVYGLIGAVGGAIQSFFYYCLLRPSRAALLQGFVTAICFLGPIVSVFCYIENTLISHVLLILTWQIPVYLLNVVVFRCFQPKAFH